MSEHVVPVGVYYRVFAVLLILTALTVTAAYPDFGRLNAVIALTIAVIKATLVILFFMHVRYSPRLTWLVVSGGFFWLVVLISLTMSDMLSRGWLGFPGK
jgi:cytochrome c oxidase subunit 4